MRGGTRGATDDYRDGGCFGDRCERTNDDAGSQPWADDASEGNDSGFDATEVSTSWIRVQKQYGGDRDTFRLVVDSHENSLATATFDSASDVDLRQASATQG